MPLSQRKQGFTLIELLIVLGVIAILASILIPSVKGMQQEGDILKAKTEVKSIQTAIESYYLHHDRYYPENLSSLLQAVPRILEDLPQDPFAHGPYHYEVVSASYYIIWSNGPNKKRDFRAELQGDNAHIEKKTVGDDILTSSLPLQ